MAKRIPTTVQLDPDVKALLDARREYQGDLTRIVNTALRYYFQEIKPEEC